MVVLKKCFVFVDIVFFLDLLGSIGELNYCKMKDFVKVVVNIFIIGLGKILVVLILYGDIVIMVIWFSDYVNNVDFDVVVDVFLYLGGEICIDKVL